ncbi:MAG TPA: hypothetical protein VFW96_22595 [Thermomicrobiales bacterium]|nr:hypothetical protein [Thermomicrobiales bacterium]
MTEISTRVWLEEGQWDTVRERAVAEGTTVRALIPRLLERALAGGPPRPEAAPPPPAPAPPPPPAATEDAGPPVVALAPVYTCAVCGAQVRAGGLSNHLGKHLKEQQAAEAERSER